jgi:hypothetical protein
MVRRRGASDRVVLDLGAFGDVGTDEAGHDDPARGHAGRDAEAWPDEAAASLDGFVALDASVRARARRTRAVVGASAVALLAFSAWGTASEIQDREGAQRLMSAPGGVLSLADAPRVTWSAATESADSTAYMPGLIVVRRGTVLHGLDAGTGAERWQVPVGGDPQCHVSTSAQGGGAVVDSLVCWGGPNAAPQVTVVHADGSSATRTLSADVAWAAGTADGGLATVRTVGPPTPVDPVTVTPLDNHSYTVDGTITHGQDVVLRLEDAASGAVRWERTVTFRPGSAASVCGTVTEDRTAAQPTYTYSLQRPQVLVLGTLVEAFGCGIQAAFTSDGRSAIDPTVSASDWWNAEPYADGGVLTHVNGNSAGEGFASVLTGPGGTTTFPAQVLEPWATDGTPSDLVLVDSGSDPLRAYARDGTPRWHVARIYSALLVRAHGIAVLSLPQGGVAGVDLLTGDQLWDNTALEPGASGTETFPMGAFTDGRMAALLMGRYSSTVDENGGSISLDATSAELVGLDLATGRVRWRTALPGGIPSMEAVQGHLVGTARQDNTFINDDGPGGAFVDHSPGTVYSLGAG